MSGICGIFNLDGRPAAPELIQRMTAAIAHRGPDGIHHVIDGPVALGHCMLCTTPESLHETQPLWDETKQYCLTLDGRVDNREDLTRDLKSKGAHLRDDTDAELVLKAYIVWGEDSPGRILGDFAYIIWDRYAHRLFCARDIFGVRTLYWSIVGSAVVLASEIRAVIATGLVARNPNREAVAAFLVGGPRNDPAQTFISGVRSVLPSTFFLFSLDARRSSSYWSPENIPDLRFRSPSECADAFRSVFVASVSRRMRAAYPVAVGLSGGLDSSAIFCVADNLTRTRPHSLSGVSYSADDCGLADERQFVDDIARNSCAEIVRLPMLMGLGSNPVECISQAEAPFLDCKWSNTDAFYRAVRRSGARTLMTGNWGDDLLFDRSYLIDLFTQYRFRDVARHLGAYHAWLSDIPARQFWCSFLQRSLRCVIPPAGLKLARSFKRRSNRTLPWCALLPPSQNPPQDSNATGSEYRRSMLAIFDPRLTTSHMEWEVKGTAAYSLELVLPYLDRNVVSFLVGIPGEMQNPGGVPKGLLRTALASYLPPSVAGRRWKGDATTVVLDGINEALGAYTKELTSGLGVSLGYLNSYGLEKTLGPETDSFALRTCFRRAVGLELWLKWLENDRKEQHEEREYWQETDVFVPEAASIR